MKKFILFFLFASILISCKKENQENFGKTATETTSTTQKPEDLGKEIFEGKGICYTCHKADSKTVGPSIIDIAKIYREKKGNLVAFLQEKSEPIVDPSQYATMKTNFAITKNLPEEELKAIEAYIFSFK